MRRMVGAVLVGILAIGLGASTGKARAGLAAGVDTQPRAGAGPSEVAPPPKLAAAIAHLGQEVRSQPDGTLTIANGAYRATFAATTGVAYTPRIGQRLEPRLRWQYRARALESAAGTRRLEPVTPRVSPAGDHIVEFERPGLLERYEGERSGVEQIFVLTEKPAAAGDVRIRGDVTFSGIMRPAPGGGITFTAPGLPAFTYAAPVAFDATGARLPVRAEIRGAELQLVVDGAALAGAQLPVTIDPLFGVTTVESFAFFWGLDLAYCPERAEFLVVYPSLGDGEDVVSIRARRYAEMGDPIGPSFLVSSGYAEWKPAVAYDQEVGRYLVTWQRTVSEPAEITLRAQLLDPIGQEVGSELVLSTTFAPIEAAAVIARNHRPHLPTDVAFVVALQDHADPGNPSITMVRVRGNGTIVNAVHLDAGREPDLSYDPLTDRVLVVYRQGATVLARTMTSGGSVAANATTLSTSGSGGPPVVAFDLASRRHLAVYQGANAYGTSDLRGSLLDTSATPGQIASVTIAAGSASLSNRTHGVTAESGTFVVGYKQSDDTVRSRRLRADGLLISDTYWATAGSEGQELALAAGAHGSTPILFLSDFEPEAAWSVRLGLGDRWFARYVHGGNAGDFDGDGRSDLFLWRPHAGEVVVKTQAGASWYVFAIPGGLPALMDYDGDGRTDITLWEPSTGKWWIRKSSDGNTEIVTLGDPGDVPVPGDYLGQGKDQVAIFRPRTATWYIKASRLARPITLVFGQVGDMPTPADWDGDGDTELGLWRPSTGIWYAAQPDGATVSVPASAWGQAGDFPLAGDFVGGSRADQVIYRRQLGVFYRRDGATGATSTITVGSGLPMPLDWDGDGKLDLVLFDVESGLWIIKDPSGTQTISFGGIGDIPAGAR